MVFSSSTFLFYFMPLFFAGYFICPGRTCKNLWLLAASLVFYAWGEPIYVLLMIVSIAANWVFALAMGVRDRGRRSLLITAVVFNCLVISFFKYEGFLANNLNALFGSAVIPNLDLPLPIGISFYTLQALSYVIDVYKREVEPQRNILFLGMYIACFPQLIAGPIVRYQTIQDQILNRKETLADFSSGLRLFIIGLSKKVLLANVAAILANKMLGMGGMHIGAVGAWAGLIAYTFQIYFDFCGYSEMAIGLGRMMGFRYLRNFNYPYISQSITEFWRRWHISLSTFFRDYVYIPLGGSRVKKTRHIVNIMVVWSITGLWHGAAWNYVLWGMYYGLLLVMEKYVWGGFLSRMPRVMRHVYTVLVFVFGWSFFWISDSSQLVVYWQALVGMYGATGDCTLWELTAWEYWPFFVVCVFASTPVFHMVKAKLIAWIEGRKAESRKAFRVVDTRDVSTDNLCVFSACPSDRGKGIAYSCISILYDIALAALLVLCVMSVVSGSFNPFIYFQF